MHLNNNIPDAKKKKKKQAGRRREIDQEAVAVDEA